LSSYHRLFARNILPCRLQQPSANYCQAVTVHRRSLYSDVSRSGQIISRHCLVPSSDMSHTLQQKSLLSVSAAVSAASTANVVQYANLHCLYYLSTRYAEQSRYCLPSVHVSLNISVSLCNE